MADHEVTEFATGRDVVTHVSNHQVDLCVLDLMLPESSGFQIAEEIGSFSDIPVLILTARDDKASRITGFEVGADDYLVKPFSPRELVLRVNAILRRSSEAVSRSDGHIFVLGGSRLQIQKERHRAYLGDFLLELTNTEWRMLLYLSMHPDQVVSRDRLMNSVLDYSSDISSRTVDSHIRNLGAKIGDARWIETIRSVGYRFAGTPELS